MFTEGDTWKEHRRFSISCLRDFGMGSTVLERKIHDEVSHLLQELANFEGVPIDPTNFIPKAVSNIICSIIYGARFDYSDEGLLQNIFAFKPYSVTV